MYDTPETERRARGMLHTRIKNDRIIDKNLIMLPYKFFAEQIKFTTVIKQPNPYYDEQAIRYS